MAFDWSLITQILGFIAVIIAIVTATYKITRHITKLEDRISEIEGNPLLVAFKKTEEDRATRLVSLEENIKRFEAQKIGRNVGGEGGGEEKK